MQNDPTIIPTYKTIVEISNKFSDCVMAFWEGTETYNFHKYLQTKTLQTTSTSSLPPKLKKKSAQLSPKVTSNLHHREQHPQEFSNSPTNITLECLQALIERNIAKVIRNAPSKSCELDPIPTELLKDTWDNIALLIEAVVNKSMINGEFPDLPKEALVWPLLSRPILIL